MIRVGITGQSGFIGTHLYNYLSLKRDEIAIVPFSDHYFEDENLLNSFVKNCDVIVHLAAVNRHRDPVILYNTNIGLVKQLINVCETTHSFPHILFSSSTQEERDNEYGKSKREGRALLEEWAARSNASFTGLVIPNVFGPFGNPYYNSVIATFCYQLTHDEEPRIDVDSSVKLIYVGELTKIIYEKITGSKETLKRSICYVPHTSEHRVSEILEILNDFKRNYLFNGMIPDLNNRFILNLFNTFICFIDHRDFFPFILNQNEDNRGVYVETIKTGSGGQVSFSTTKPGITRGNHFHTRKAERFAVIKGQARIELRRIGTNNVLSFDLDGSRPSFVDMPVWFTHNITNTGSEELITLFWCNEQFNPEDSDTYFEKV